MDKIFAGIISYNPDIDRLRDNISSVLPQVQGLIVVDNASDNIADIIMLLDDFRGQSNLDMAGTSKCNILLIENDKNTGVAHALNQIMKHVYSLDHQAWVLTLDQDTVIYDDLIDMYREFMDAHRTDSSMHVASLTSLRKDRNYTEHNHNGEWNTSETGDEAGDGFTFVHTCITSGNLVSVAAWYKVRGFDERLFIDMVDDEFCLRLEEADYDIVRINRYGCLHELGSNLIRVHVLGKEKMIFAYPPMRKFYTARNIIYMIRRYRLGTANPYTSYLLKRMAGTLIYERHRIKGVMAYIRGICAGFRLDCTK